MKRSLLLAGAAALALGLPATAALADGVNRRPAVHTPKPKPAAKPMRHHAKPAPQRQARHAPARRNNCCVQSAMVEYEELETVERSVYEERNGVSYGPVTSYSERYIAPSRGCYAHAPCGYSTGDHAGVSIHRGAVAGGYGHEHSMHHGASAYGHDHAVHHGAAYGYGAAPIQPGFHHGPLTGGVGYGVDGGPVYGSTVVIRPGGYGHGFAARGFSSGYSSASSSAYSSGHASSGGYYNYGSRGAYGGHTGYGHGGGYGQGGSPYLGFKPSPYGQGIGTTGYTGFRR